MGEDLQQTVHSAIRGDLQAFDSLFGRNLPKLMAYIRLRMGAGLATRESVSDIAQSVCREALEDMSNFEYRGDEAFRKWLFTQAARKLVDRHRYYTRGKRDMAREVRAPVRDNEDHESLITCYATFCSPSQSASARDELARIESALHELPENQREAVAMSKLIGISNKEIAQHLNCTEGALRALIARGLAKLAIALGEQ